MLIFFQDIPTDFPSNKLLQGAGPLCVFILDCLATQALKISKNRIDKFELAKEEEITVEILENDSEIILEKVEEENASISEDSDEDQDRKMNFNFNGIDNGGKADLFNNNNLRFDTLSDSENWRLELERVLPQLKIFVKNDPRDWRAHIEQMKTYITNIDTVNFIPIR